MEIADASAWKVKPEYADRWVELTRDFTEATRAEEGNLLFEWSRSVDDPNPYVLIEAFEDVAAEAHVTADYFKRAQAELPQYVQEIPKVRKRADGGRPLGLAWGVRGQLSVGPAVPSSRVAASSSSRMCT